MRKLTTAAIAAFFVAWIALYDAPTSSTKWSLWTIFILAPFGIWKVVEILSSAIFGG